MLLYFLFCAFLTKIFQCYIFIDNQASELYENGTENYPYRNLSFALENFPNILSNYDFVLNLSPFAYEFFSEYPQNSNVSIYSSP